MANRSYLYGIDYDSREIGWKKEGKIQGVSESPYDIPLSYKILVSVNPKLSKSINWEYKEAIAIIGDFEEGKKRLFDFLDNLSSYEFFEKEEFEKVVASCKEFLNNPKRDLKYAVLEGAEIYEMDSDKIEQEAEKLFENEITEIEATIASVIGEMKGLKERKVALEQELEVVKEDVRLEIEDLEKELIMKKENITIEGIKGLYNKIFKGKGLKEIEELQKKLDIKKEAKKAKKIEKEIELVGRSLWDIVGIDYWAEVLYYHFDENQ